MADVLLPRGAIQQNHPRNASGTDHKRAFLATIATRVVETDIEDVSTLKPDLLRLACGDSSRADQTPGRPVGQEDMTSWLRVHMHPDPASDRISCTAIWEAGQYVASVVEPEGESRVPERVLCGQDTAAAKDQADLLLLDAYPHDCRDQRRVLAAVRRTELARLGFLVRSCLHEEAIAQRNDPRSAGPLAPLRRSPHLEPRPPRRVVREGRAGRRRAPACEPPCEARRR